MTKYLNLSQIKEAIKQRLQYSFEFDEKQSEDELKFLFASKSVIFKEEHYVMNPRIGASNALNRTAKRQIYKHLNAIIKEA